MRRLMRRLVHVLTPAFGSALVRTAGTLVPDRTLTMMPTRPRALPTATVRTARPLLGTRTILPAHHPALARTAHAGMTHTGPSLTGTLPRAALLRTTLLGSTPAHLRPKLLAPRPAHSATHTRAAAGTAIWTATRTHVVIHARPHAAAHPGTAEAARTHLARTHLAATHRAATELLLIQLTGPATLTGPELPTRALLAARSLRIAWPLPAALPAITSMTRSRIPAFAAAVLHVLTLPVPRAIIPAVITAVVAPIFPTIVMPTIRSAAFASVVIVSATTIFRPTLGATIFAPTTTLRAIITIIAIPALIAPLALEPRLLAFRVRRIGRRRTVIVPGPILVRRLRRSEPRQHHHHRHRTPRITTHTYSLLHSKVLARLNEPAGIGLHPAAYFPCPAAPAPPRFPRETRRFSISTPSENAIAKYT